MSKDLELEAWQRQWQAEAVVPSGLCRRVERNSRFMRFTLLAEILVTVVIGGGTAALAVRSPRLDMVVLAAGTWSFLAAAWAFALLTRRGLWSPAAVTTAAFVDLSIRRCRMALTASVFGIVLYFSEIVFCLAWIYDHRALSRLITLVTVCSVMFLASVVIHRRKKRAELDYLLRLADN